MGKRFAKPYLGLLSTKSCHILWSLSSWLDINPLNLVKPLSTHTLKEVLDFNLLYNISSYDEGREWVTWEDQQTHATLTKPPTCDHSITYVWVSHYHVSFRSTKIITLLLY